MPESPVALPPAVVPTAAPWPPPGYSTLPTAPDNGKVALIVVVVVLLVSVILISVVLLSAMVFFMVVGLESGPPTGVPPPIQLEAGTWSSGALAIAVVSAPNGVWLAANLTFEVRDARGTLYFNGASGARQGVNGTALVVSFGDHDGDLWASAGDTINIQVQPTANATLLSGGSIAAVDTFGTFAGSVLI